MTRLHPAEWRLITALYHPDRDDRTANAIRLCDDQQATREHLTNLEARDFIRVTVAGLDVALDDIAGGNRGLTAVTVRLTRKGHTKVRTDPLSRVVGALVKVSLRASVLYLRKYANVDDGVLRELETAGIITAYVADSAGAVSLSTFRRIPPGVFIRLTRKGCRYWALPSSASSPGRQPHAAAGAAAHD